MKTLKTILTNDFSGSGGHLIKKTVMDFSADYIGSYQDYISISGFAMAVQEYWDHNVDDYHISENDKWYGIEVFLPVEKTDWLYKNFKKETLRFVVPQYIMKAKVKDYRHAQNLFRKYLKPVN